MNIQAMMKQAKKMQEEYTRKIKELNETVFELEKQGIKIEMYGDRTLKSINIHQALVDPEDKETLEDVIILAINELIAKINEKHEQSAPSSGMGL
ncbi:YbaB/EbfC family nucleoid-associated protein [Mesomycoplasma molare]|uniref:Nucleoid-associated protein NX772_02380 n=1 Tax=Mesomycoplasma molare TaxID=171288 RepID=A0ABY5TWN4_9BACT|nr:YbaB/EbfC family nucleoid-associated protein [Mesomycoplasma molare]UWD33936.1 YbaB/EbfC family nucleoid-associated protein [Mesomycoplasma molare]